LQDYVFPYTALNPVCFTDFYGEGGETLAQVAQRSGRYPIPRTIQGQVRRGSEQHGLSEDVPAHCRGLDQMTFKGPFQPKPFRVWIPMCKMFSWLPICRSGWLHDWKLS